MKVTICIGISASGKTAWAVDQNATIICRDDIRIQILESELNRSLAPGELWKLWKFKREDEVTKIVQIVFQDAADKQQDVIFADTNLVPKYRNGLIEKAESLGYEVEIKNFPIDFETAIKRDLQRANSVGHEVIWRQYKQWFAEFGQFPKYVPDTSLPPTYVFDIDGTIADCVGIRSPFEWDKVDQDRPREVVLNVLDALGQAGFEIVILSGRDGSCRGKTVRWLEDNYVEFSDLFMREAGDSRKDWIIKGELFYKNVAPEYNVVGVFDDRAQMVEFWSLIDVPCFNVGSPNVRF